MDSEKPGTAALEWMAMPPYPPKTKEELSVADGEESEPAMVLQMQDITASVEVRPIGDGRELALVVSDGRSRVEITGRLGRRSEGAKYGAQRLATSALDYAVGLLVLDLPSAAEE
jgi:hypothetical protein